MYRPIDSERYKDKGFFKTHKIAISTLDHFVLTKRIKKIEYKVLLGAKKTIIFNTPDIIFEANRVGDFKKCEKILGPMGYKFSRLDNNNYLAICEPEKTE